MRYMLLGRPRNRYALFLCSTALALTVCAQNSPVNLGKVYRDETHCLGDLEIRSDADNAISCHCRDALVDLRYVYQSKVRHRSSWPCHGIITKILTTAHRRCLKSSGSTPQIL